jgi:hypothetical protein
MRETAFGICKLQMLRCGHCHFCHEHRCASPTIAHGLGDLGRDRACDNITITGFRARGLVFGGDAIFDPDNCRDRSRYRIARNGGR